MIQAETCDIFSKQSSLIMRVLFEDPAMKWTANQLARKGISLGQANKVLHTLNKMGYLSRTYRGRSSYSQVWPDMVRSFKSQLLKKWTEAYTFERNKRIILHDIKGDFLPRFRNYMSLHKSEHPYRYALTLFSGAEQTATYVMNQPLTLYVNVPKGSLNEFAMKLQDQLGLLRLVDGGNVTIASPYYGDAVFYGSRIIKQDPVVSNLQLYLDLHTYPHGREQIEYLNKFYQKRGEKFV